LIPLWLKLAYTAMAVLVLAVYWYRYGAKNYLWFSDVALIGLVPALWLESAYVASMMAAGMLALELFWNLSFFGQLLTGHRISGLTDYMFERERPLWLRALSLFHVVVPAAMIYLLAVLGYHPDAVWAMIVLAWLVLPASYPVATPKENINWVLGFGRVQTWMPPWRFVFLLMLLYPLLVYVPSHFALLWVVPAAP
jgi:hypothetical protein